LRFEIACIAKKEKERNKRPGRKCKRKYEKMRNGKGYVKAEEDVDDDDRECMLR